MALVIIDGLPHRKVSPELTPCLWRQVMGGGRAPEGGLSLPVSVTYANHATFVTGADAVETNIFGNAAWDNEVGWVPSPSVGPRLPTLFDRVAERAGRSAMVAGDHELVAQMGADAASSVWPPNGVLPSDTATCAYGYASDEAVVAATAATDLDVDLAVLHLNEPDTTNHRFGPDSSEAEEQLRSTDHAYGRLIDLLGDGRWSETVVITLSDHDHEPITDQEPVDLAAALTASEIVTDGCVVHDGTAALIRADDLPIDAVRAVGGVESVAPLAPGFWMAWTQPGRSFGTRTVRVLGQHGSPRCRTQVAGVSGGHPAARVLARRIERERPSVTDWAPLIDDLLGGRP